MRLRQLVSHWMTDNPHAVSPERPVLEAEAIMAEGAFRHMPVVDADGCLVGIISDRDVYRCQNIQRPVREIMTPAPELHCVDPLCTIEDAAKALLRTKVHSLLVVDGSHLVGILTSHDMMRALVETARHEAERTTAPPLGV